MIASAILVFVTCPFCCSLDAWWEFKWRGYSYGLTRSDVEYYIRLNRKAGWKNPQEKI